jgi:hypothetical protein
MTNLGDTVASDKPENAKGSCHTSSVAKVMLVSTDTYQEISLARICLHEYILATAQQDFYTSRYDVKWVYDRFLNVRISADIQRRSLLHLAIQKV